MKKHIEILFIKVAIWILMGRNLTRCMVVSRRDNNNMWYMAERLEAIVQRMGEEYRAGHYRISILLNMIADSVKTVAEAEKIGIKIMELRDKFDEVKITIEEYPPKKKAR